MNIMYYLSDVLQEKAKLVNYELAKANFYRILAWAHYVNSTNNPVYLKLGDCEVIAHGNSMSVKCHNSVYFDNTDLPIVGVKKGEIRLVKYGTNITIE